MANLTQISTHILPSDIMWNTSNLELTSLTNQVLEEYSDSESHDNLPFGQDKDRIESGDKQEILIEEKSEVNILDDIIQLIELVSNCVTKDGTTGKTKYKDGFLYLENLQAQFENIQKEVSEKAKTIKALETENCSLKQEVNTVKKELNNKCRLLEELRKSFSKLQKKIRIQNNSKKSEPASISSFEDLTFKVDKVQERFKQLCAQTQGQLATKTKSSFHQQDINFKKSLVDTETLVRQLEHKMRLLGANKKKIEEQLVQTELSFNNLNDMLAIKSAPSKPQKSPVNVKPVLFEGFGLNTNAQTPPPISKPLSIDPYRTNDQYDKNLQLVTNYNNLITNSILSNNLSYPATQQLTQKVSVEHTMGHGDTLKAQQYSNLFGNAQNKCSQCGMTFFTPDQLKLHCDLVHSSHINTSGPNQKTISSASPNGPFLQKDIPNAPLPPALQKYYNKRMWASSQPFTSTHQSMTLDNSSFSNENTYKRHCGDLSTTSSVYSLVHSIPNGRTNSTI